MDDAAHSATAERTVASAGGDLPSAELPLVPAIQVTTNATAKATAAAIDLHGHLALKYWSKKPLDHIVLVRLGLEPFRDENHAASILFSPDCLRDEWTGRNSNLPVSGRLPVFA